MIFKKIDENLSRAIEAFQESAAYSGIGNVLENLDDEMRKLLGQLAGLAIISFPIIICLVFFSINLYKKSALEDKREMLALAKDYVNKKRGISQLSRQFIGANDIAEQGQLLDMIKQGIPGSDAPPSIEKFEQTEITDEIIRTDSKVVFQGLTLNALMGGIKVLAEKFRIHVVDIQVEKDEQKKFIGFF